MKMHSLLFSRIDNSPLLIFRIFFGFLVACEGFGAILTGWVRKTLIEPVFTFTFIGFEWLQPLPGPGMYIYFMVMGVLGIFIMLGLKYRFSIIAFTVLWTAVYLMQKTSYNNHYYLLALISLLMCFLPAEKNMSLDAKRNADIRENAMYSWVKWVIVLQLFIVYTYASIAKMYPDWLSFKMPEMLMASKAHYPIIGDMLQHAWVHKSIGLSGLLFDLFVVPALLWKPPRKIAFGASIFFHLFNSIVFQIGIFPFLSLAFCVFFFEPRTIQRLFFKKKSFFERKKTTPPSYRNIFFLFFGIYFLIQILLPLRHHFIKDNVLWTEEGHRLSWRMMLRNRNGSAQFKVIDKQTGKKTNIALKDHLSKKQQRKVQCYPDFMWQFAQYLQKEFAVKGMDVSVFVKAKISINGRPYRAFIDPKVDLANEKWNHFGHHDWILPSQLTLSD